MLDARRRVGAHDSRPQAGRGSRASPWEVTPSPIHGSGTSGKMAGGSGMPGWPATSSAARPSRPRGRTRRCTPQGPARSPARPWSGRTPGPADLSDIAARQTGKSGRNALDTHLWIERNPALSGHGHQDLGPVAHRRREHRIHARTGQECRIELVDVVGGGDHDDPPPHGLAREELEGTGSGDDCSPSCRRQRRIPSRSRPRTRRRERVRRAPRARSRAGVLTHQPTYRAAVRAPHRSRQPPWPTTLQAGTYRYRAGRGTRSGLATACGSPRHPNGTVRPGY